MQGNLNEIDIRSIFQLIELGQRTGELFVEAYGHSISSVTSHAGGKGLTLRKSQSQKQQSWFVFFLSGQIVYVTDCANNLSRLRDYLHRYQLETSLESVEAPSLATHNAPEYGYLWALLEKHIITPAQGRSIIHSMVHETLFDLLSLHEGCFIFEHGSALAPQLTTLEVDSLVTKVMQQVQEWKQLHPHIQSPDQCLAITDLMQLRQELSAATIERLERLIDGKTSLRRLARCLNRDILTVGRAVYPFIKNGWIQLFYPPGNEHSNKNNNDLQGFSEVKIPCIVCIDDAVTICKAVESILKLQGYEAIGCSYPLQAFSLVFQLQPDLILCDIAMPELDGYEFCAMLRRSSRFRQTPIVMLTGKDQFIDRVKARMVGATDYLTKPFTDGELLMLVEKHLGVGRVAALYASD